MRTWEALAIANPAVFASCSARVRLIACPLAGGGGGGVVCLVFKCQLAKGSGWLLSLPLWDAVHSVAEGEAPPSAVIAGEKDRSLSPMIPVFKLSLLFAKYSSEILGLFSVLRGWRRNAPTRWQLGGSAVIADRSFKINSALAFVITHLVFRLAHVVAALPSDNAMWWRQHYCAVCLVCLALFMCHKLTLEEEENFKPGS